MRTIAKDKTSSAVTESGASKDAVQENWFRKHWCMVALCVIAILAFVLRFVFAFGTSAGDNFALSGGTNASSHHRIITDILWGTYDPASQASVNYPFGAESVSGPLFDYCCAAWAKLFTAFGVSYEDAASMALAVNPPIFGALTCIPVFLLARRFFKDDVIAVVSALFYAVFPLLIMTTPFSYGSEFPFVAFLMAGLIFFVVSAFDNIDKSGATGIKAVFTQKPIVLWVALGAVFMTFIIYSWTGFWAIVMASSVMLFLTLVFDRIGGRDFGTVIGVYIGVVTVPVLIGAVYYYMIGAWATVLSGGLTLALLATVYAIIFLALEKKPWVFTIPGMVVLIAVVAAVIYFVAPSLSSAVLSGNSIYTGSLMAALVDTTSRTSISAMASYYGWVTVWCPLFYGVWMAIKYRGNAKSKAYTFVMLWIFAGFIACWYSTEYAILAGSVFALASAATLVGIIRYVDLKSYFRSLRGNGVKAGARKALNFFPLVTVLVAVFLVAVPTAVYAVDAARPTNGENVDYFGGLGYTINTSDSSLVNSAWSGVHAQRGSTLLTWYGYSDTASSVGGFKTVTSSTGSGTAAMASAYLADGSAGTVATLLIRLVEQDATKYTNVFSSFEKDVSYVVKLISDNAEARDYIAKHSDDFVGRNAELSDENLPYLAGVHYLTSTLNEKQINSLYSDLKAVTGASIDYIELDGSMIPLYSGDGSYTNYIAYFGDYAMGGSYGSSPTSLYSVTSTTYYYYYYGYYDQMYYTYNDSMYSTFLWNALIGVTPSDCGLSGNLELLSALAKSDGTIKAKPLNGIDNFDIAYWHVNYQAKDSDDWKDLDVNEALARQATEGGYINYLSSVIMLKYNASSSFETSSIHAADDDYSGMRVAVYEELSAGDVGYDPSGKTSNYVLRSTTFVNSAGAYSVSIPASGHYLVKYYVGATSLYDGILFKTLDHVDVVDKPIIAVQEGKLVDGNGKVIENSGAYITFVGSDAKVRTSSVADDGTFSFTDIPADKYTVTVYSATDATLNTLSLNLTSSDGTAVTGLTVSAGSCTLDITVNDMYGNVLPGTVTVTIRGTNGITQNVDITDGNGNAKIVAGTYTVSIDDGTYVSFASSSVTATASESSKVTLVAHRADSIGSVSSGTVAMAIGYSKVATGTSVNVPVTVSGALTTYSYDAANNKVTYNGNTVDAITVKGVLKKDGSATSGAVNFISADGQYTFTFVTAADGTYEAHVPALNYTIYATDGSSNAYLGSKDCSSASGEVSADFDLVSASVLTFTANYQTLMSPTTNGICYVPVVFTISDGKIIPAITGTSGVYKLIVPTGTVVSIKVDKAVFTSTDFTVRSDYTCNDVTVSEAVSKTFTINAKDNDAHDADSFVNTVTVEFKTGSSNAINFKFDAYAGSSYDFNLTLTGTESKSGIVPGRYTVTSESDGFYISKTVYIYPDTVSVDLTSGFECTKVTVTKVNTDDVVSVVTVSQNLDKQEVVTSGNEYYLPVGGEYYFVITNSAGDKICRPDHSSGEIKDYGSLFTDKVTLKGYVGSKTSGDIKATSAAGIYLITVKDGEYSVSLPKGTEFTSMKLTAEVTPESSQYTYSVTDQELIASALTVSADKTINFGAGTTRTAAKNDTFTAVKFDGSHMTAGVGTLHIEVTREVGAEIDAPAITYVISSGSGFTLDEVYTISFAKDAPSATVDIKGRYNESAIGAGNANASLTISTVDGTEVQTVVVPGSCYTATGSVVYDSESVSAIDGYSYKFAVAFNNSEKGQALVKITGTNYTSSDYKVVIVDASGYYVTELGNAYELTGLDTTTLYVMFIKVDEDSNSIIPASITVEYSISNDGSSWTAGTQTVERASAEISVDDASVSGGNADNTKADVSTGFWIVTVFTILLLLLLVWGGMKRGVFSRRN